MSYKVIVVGGGIIGTSTTYYLSKLGAEVTLIESTDIAAGTSGSCDRAIMLQSKSPGPTLDLAFESARMYKNLEEELCANLEYRMGGGMIVIETPPEMEAMTCFIQRQHEAGLDVQLLSGEEARAKQPGLSKDILGSTWWPNDAEVNPLNVSFAFARAAKRLGTDIRLHTGVARILTEGERVVGVETSSGEPIYADAVVAATGVWTPILLKTVGLNIPIKPRRGQILVTERIPPFLHRNILSAAYIAAKLNKASAGYNPAGVGLAIGQTSSGNLLIGGSREFVGYNTSTSVEVTREIVRRALNVFPDLARVRMIRSFAGLRPYTPDAKPIISSVEQWKGLYIAAGHEGDGIALAPITGKVAAHLVCQLNPGIDLAPFSLSRFEHMTTEKVGAH